MNLYFNQNGFPMRLNISFKMAVAVLAFSAMATGLWSQTGKISGRLADPAGNGLGDANVVLSGASGGSWSEVTDANGNYEFDVPLGDTYTIDPYSNVYPLNGVTTFDAVLITQYIDGILDFSSPYLIIASDADCSNSVNLADTIEIRKLILGIYTNFPCAGSYRFVSADYVFPDPFTPFPFPETIVVNNLSGDVSDQDFIGIKIADINGSSSVSVTGIKGQVRLDNNSDCLASVTEPPLEDWIVTAYGANNINFTGTTVGTGNYFLNVFPGTYDVVLTPPNALWDICADTVFGVTVGFLDTVSVNYAVQPVTSCPLLDVDLSTIFLRRCFESTYNVFYCNKGTALAEDAYVDVELDPYLLFVSSTLPVAAVNGNTYTFQLGDLEPGQCEQFEIVVEVSCEATLGQTHCSEAQIYPDTSCLEQQFWNGANLEVTSECQNDEVIFTVTNTGEAMTEPVNYIVIEDIMVQMTGGSIQLGTGQSQQITIPANGSTWRIEIEQVPNNPWNTIVSEAIEGCGENNNGTFSLGFVTQFPESEYGGHHDEDCLENIGSYDPNDKQGLPSGVTEQHFIPKGTEIEYKIRFQNTGTDTAFTVRIVDSLSQYLDATTLRPGSSSHPYDFKMTGAGVAQFTFYNIMLPDSNVNEPASNGYVKFSIKPKPNLPNNTAVENEAGIYFDFNPPVITNRTLHTVGEQFLNVSTVVFRPGIDLEVSPNPASDRAIFTIKSATPTEGTLQVFDLQGRLVRTQAFGTNVFELDATGMVPGMYLFRLESGGGVIAAGKLSVQRRD